MAGPCVRRARGGLAEVCAELSSRFTFRMAAGYAASGLLRGAVYLVRPDGYVAVLADAPADPERLRDYFGAGGAGTMVRHATG